MEAKGGAWRRGGQRKFQLEEGQGGKRGAEWLDAHVGQTPLAGGGGPASLWYGLKQLGHLSLAAG